MKHMTIWQRLNTALLLLILLVLAGVGLALWVAEARSGGVHRSDQLSAARDRIYLDVVIMSEWMRGLLLEPRSDPDQKRRNEAEKDLGASLDSVQAAFPNSPDLVNSVTAFRTFALKTMSIFNSRVVELVGTDQ